MRIAVLFDGAGLARLGLEQAGHQCTGYEIDEKKHLLSLSVGSGNCIHADAREVDLSAYDAVWASPPCQLRSFANTRNRTANKYANGDLLAWSLSLPHLVLWVENVPSKHGFNNWGHLWNAAQFLQQPIQNRVRIIGGRYKLPEVFWGYKRFYKGICPTILASEERATPTGWYGSFQFYGRKLTVEECAYHQGFSIPKAWYDVPTQSSKSAWLKQMYESIGNGVPCYMAYAFGKRYKP